MPSTLNNILQVQFSRKTNLSHQVYSIGGEPIELNRVNDLGVLLYTKLYLKGHMDEIVSKVKRNLGLIKWLARPFQNPNSCLTFNKF